MYAPPSSQSSPALMTALSSRPVIICPSQRRGYGGCAPSTAGARVPRPCPSLRWLLYRYIFVAVDDKRPALPLAAPSISTPAQRSYPGSPLGASWCLTNGHLPTTLVERTRYQGPRGALSARNASPDHLLICRALCGPALGIPSWPGPPFSNPCRLNPFSTTLKRPSDASTKRY